LIERIHIARKSRKKEKMPVMYSFFLSGLPSLKYRIYLKIR